MLLDPHAPPILSKAQIHINGCPKNTGRCPKKCKPISALSRYLLNRARRADNPNFICSFGAPSIGDTLSHANWTLVRKIYDTKTTANGCLFDARLLIAIIPTSRKNLAVRGLGRRAKFLGRG